MLSTMIGKLVDGSTREKLKEFGERVVNGGSISREEANWLFALEDTADIFDLLSWANRIREHYKGNKIHLCSIVNAKAGACSENCSFCAQSAFHQTGSPRYGFVDPEPVLEAAEEANKHGVTAVGLVAAWKGLNEGPMLDEVCDRIRDLKKTTKTRPDASLGIIKSQKVADRLKEAGLECYGHNLETSRRFFPSQCTTHTYEDRIETIGYLKKAGIKICSGGIIGMGETRQDRCDLAFALKEVGANVVPINILNPIPGTPFADKPKLPPMEILKTIACFRFILPKKEIMIAGGRTVNLRDMQSMIFMAGASALMVGNYLTTLNQPVEKDLQMLKDLGLDPSWDKHDFVDQEDETSACGCSQAETAKTAAV
ncbi:biotin synthase [Pedosphaera parvula Ellin514]|uniref:Biotin synthase n=2 Tax=Pedosphaera TaxID=1032526 RepID=B9XGH9_PEDPL|nr:biotin synthase [Pedosphaera parvula Ellin514]